MGNLEVLFKKAIEEGDIKKIENLIDECDFLNLKDKLGYELLNNAVFIFNKESDVENKNNIIKIINILCKNGADINSESLKFNNLGVTPLKSAIILNDLELVKNLIDLGADVNKEDKLDPYSPLMRAVAHSNLDIIKEIINNGGDIKYKNSVSEGLLHVFCMSRRKELFNEMIWSEVNFRMELDSKTKQGMTALMVACIYGNIDMVNYLLESGASINEKDTKGNTALIWTVTNPLDITEEERLDIVRILLENNCD
ncbi:ankyrin repeat domain-containing protein, partial [Clostridium chrysemydis]|uniref:ankyrin repeat domain-containing protein n=1 Tax=Clostridium chrysemydis TaxID=2665504 RepID=UPI003F30AD97